MGTHQKKHTGSGVRERRSVGFIFRGKNTFVAGRDVLVNIKMETVQAELIIVQ